jgi:hypothetical protein
MPILVILLDPLGYFLLYVSFSQVAEVHLFLVLVCTLTLYRAASRGMMWFDCLREGLVCDNAHKYGSRFTEFFGG